MATKPFNVRLDESIIKIIKKFDESQADIVSKAIRFWYETDRDILNQYNALKEANAELERRTLAELKGGFTPNELKAIVANMNGVILQPQFMCNPQMLWWHLKDGAELEGLFVQFDIDEAELESKIISLTAAQCYFLQKAANDFWYHEAKDLNEWVKKF